MQMGHGVAVKQKRAVADAIGKGDEGDRQGRPGYEEGFPPDRLRPSFQSR